MAERTTEQKFQVQMEHTGFERFDSYLEKKSFKLFLPLIARQPS